jgi:hypothetical protein
MGNGTEGRQKIREDSEAENKAVTIPANERLLGNPRAIREKRQNGTLTAPRLFLL